MFGDVYFSYVGSRNNISVQHHGTLNDFFYDGRFVAYKEAETLLFPSREMRDWRKFSWKKGDVLASEGEHRLHVIFEGFKDDTYTRFKGKHYLCNYDDDEDYNEEEYNGYKKEVSLRTIGFEKENEDAAQTYINIIEECLGGKLNRETLEIEPAQPEFKDGDFVCISCMGYLSYGIVKSIDYSSKKLEYYVLNDMSFLKINDWLSLEDKQIQPITETQQIILFEALAKEGKAWDAEKKQIVDLKPKVELKPFDKVLVRDDNDTPWKVGLFSHIDGKMFLCIGSIYRQCIPYKGNEHLLGTTKDVEE